MFELKTVSKAVAAFACALSLCCFAPAASAQGVRPEVGRPLQQAADALKARRYADAAAKAREADNASNKTASEQAVIDRMRLSIASQSGDVSTMTSLISGDRLPASQHLPLVQTVANAYYTQRDFGNAATWYQRYLKEGGTDPVVRTLLLQSYYQAGDCGAVSRTLQGSIQSDEAAGRAPSEEHLGMLGSCYQRTKDNTGYVFVLEKLATYYPKKEYWQSLLDRIQTKSGFSDRLMLDVYRLKLASGLMNGSKDYMEMAQMALGDDYTSEAKKVVDQGFANKVLGASGDVERQKRLADLAGKRFAEGKANLAKDEAEAAAERDGNNLVALGYNEVGYGQTAKGIALMEQGIKKGGLRRPEEAKLHLGIAYLQAGQKAKALQVFKTVGGTDGAADLARLWSLQARRAA